MDNNGLKAKFKAITRDVDVLLDNLIPSAEIEPKRLHSAIRWSIFAGGKRFRPMLVLAVGAIFGASEAKLLRTAAAVEMIHTYSLIHDDLPAMDDDDLRRGRQTCHTKFDEATAILAGDVLQALAFQVVAEDQTLSEDVRIRLISELASASGTPFGMAAGQQLDLEAEGQIISGEQLERIHRSKTGAMISVSARAAAIIAGASTRELEAVTEYSSNLGLLFQITDDLLDVTQTTEKLGKTVGKDLEARKATYPAIYGLERTREIAGIVNRKASAALGGIERDARLLHELLDFILNRES